MVDNLYYVHKTLFMPIYEHGNDSSYERAAIVTVSVAVAVAQSRQTIKVEVYDKKTTYTLTNTMYSFI